MLPIYTENRGAHMKKIVISLLLLTLSFRLSAQIDYLEPVVLMPGEDEMGSLAYNALGALKGELPLQVYRPE